MGQMHVQRAIEMKNGPKRIIASDVDQMRLDALEKQTESIAKQQGVEIFFFNPMETDQPLKEFLKVVNGGDLADDVVVCVPSTGLMEASYQLLGPNGMFVLFAGAPIGNVMEVDISDIFMNNLQLTGTSGSTMDDQRLVVKRTVEGELSPILSVAAIGGMRAALDGLEAMMTGKYAGKIIILPQITDFPLIGLNELPEKYPDIGAHLGENNAWTYEAEKALIGKFWKP